MSILKQLTLTHQFMQGQNVKIAIQGYSGAFHEVAARLFFNGKEVTIVANDTFTELVQNVETGTDSDFGLMAIENTIAGSLMDNYRLLKESKLHAIGEVYLRIEQNLMVLPGQTIDDLDEVHSHPVAITQCRPFFKNYPNIQLVEAIDTALSAKEVREKSTKKIGAIASTAAAELYDLDIIAKGIETNKKNFTRFLLLGREREHPIKNKVCNKLSLCFSVEHEAGSLHKILAVLAAYNANLTKIQSTPIIGKEWEYMFFVDFIADPRYDYWQVLNALKPLTSNFRLLGLYPKGEHHT